MEPIKVSLSVTITLTPRQVEDWCREYGTDPANIRKDVKSYAEGLVKDSHPTDEGLWEVHTR